MIAQLWGGDGSEWLSLTFGGNNLHGIEDLGNQIHTTVLGIPQFFIDAKITYYQRKLKNLFKKKVDPASQGFVAPSSLTTEQVNQAMLLIKAGKADQVDPTIRFALGKEPKPSPTDTELGIEIIGNFHRLLEDFVQKQYEQPGGDRRRSPPGRAARGADADPARQDRRRRLREDLPRGPEGRRAGAPGQGADALRPGDRRGHDRALGPRGRADLQGDP